MVIGHWSVHRSAAAAPGPREEEGRQAGGGDSLFWTVERSREDVGWRAVSSGGGIHQDLLPDF